jgi:putative Mg2+ transporter-C (MgtC) family protein
MDLLHTIFGDIREVVPAPFSEFILVLVSIACGTIVGAERERADKPAGLRTLTLICLGSTVFTLMSIDQAFGALDRSRIAAQIVTGVGFLGAGAILRERGNIIGLTTAASIWVIAAVGMVVGVGYATSGLALAGVIFLTLTGWHRLEVRYLGTCELEELRVVFRTGQGKSWAHIQSIIDRYAMPVEIAEDRELAEDQRQLIIRYCRAHKTHRAFRGDLASLDCIELMESRSK